MVSRYSWPFMLSGWTRAILNSYSTWFTPCVLHRFLSLLGGTRGDSFCAESLGDKNRNEFVCYSYIYLGARVPKHVADLRCGLIFSHPGMPPNTSSNTRPRPMLS